MRPIHWAALDKRRPVLLLTPVEKLPWVSQVTVAPILTRARGLHTELPVGVSEGLDHPSVITCESITTILRGMLGERIGGLPADREWELRQAVLDAFELFTVDFP